MSNPLLEKLPDFLNDPKKIRQINDLYSKSTFESAFKIIRKVIAASDKKNDPEFLPWLEDLVFDLTNRINEHDNNHAYFSLHDDIRNKVIEALKSADDSLDICMFTISDNPISETIAGCHKMGIKVRILTDDGKVFDKGSDIFSLARTGIEIKIDSHRSLMHHKFVVIDNKTVLSGSYNWTRTGSDVNNENIVITNQARIVNAFSDEFDRLWKEMKPLPTL